jgi:NitT/TauT family transport system ATP-binding protein
MCTRLRVWDNLNALKFDNRVLSRAELSNSQTILQIKNISREYKTSDSFTHKVLNGLNLKVRRGEFITIIGKSGCGKSTLLNIVAGLDRSYSGELIIDNKAAHFKNPDRIVIFQENSLFPWLNVVQNIEFGLRQANAPKKLRTAMAMFYLKLVGLSDFAYANIHELSGGMRQRVSIARALSLDPRILLMDEPFAALDMNTRQLLQSELLRIHEQTKKTILFVTHNIEEAVLLGDRVILLSNSTGNIRREFVINISRPRDMSNASLREIVSEVLDELRENHYPNNNQEYASPISI